MDELERKKYFSLPPDYVTIVMLRERWLQKQEEQKLKEKQQQEELQETQNLEKDCKNQPHGELEVCRRFENNGPRKGVGKDGGEMDFIEEKGKWKEKMGWPGDGRITNKKHSHSKNKKYGADWKKRNVDIDTEKRQNPSTKEGLDLVEKKNGSKGVEIILKNKEKAGIAGFPCEESSGTQGIGKRVSVGMTDVLRKNGVREGSSQISTPQDVRRDGFRGGFRSEENDHWDEGFRSKEHGVKLKELKDNNSLGKKMEEVLQIGRKGNGRRRKQKRGQGNKFKQSGAEMGGLKLNEVELKFKNEISGIGNERDRMEGPRSGTGRNDIKHNSFNGEVLTADTLVLENKVEDTVLAEKDRNDGFRGYGNRRGNLKDKIENLTIDDSKGRYMGSKVERKFGGNSRHMNSGRLEVDRKMKQSNRGMVWVKKEQPGAVGGKASSVGVSPDKQ